MRQMKMQLAQRASASRDCRLRVRTQSCTLCKQALDAAPRARQRTHVRLARRELLRQRLQLRRRHRLGSSDCLLVLWHLVDVIPMVKKQCARNGLQEQQRARVAGACG